MIESDLTIKTPCVAEHPKDVQIWHVIEGEIKELKILGNIFKVREDRPKDVDPVKAADDFIKTFNFKESARQSKTQEEKNVSISESCEKSEPIIHEENLSISHPDSQICPEETIVHVPSFINETIVHVPGFINEALIEQIVEPEIVEGLLDETGFDPGAIKNAIYTDYEQSENVESEGQGDPEDKKFTYLYQIWKDRKESGLRSIVPEEPEEKPSVTLKVTEKNKDLRIINKRHYKHGRQKIAEEDDLYIKYNNVALYKNKMIALFLSMPEFFQMKDVTDFFVSQYEKITKETAANKARAYIKWFHFENYLQKNVKSGRGYTYTFIKAPFGIAKEGFIPLMPENNMKSSDQTSVEV
jgi:hypothetical protein